MNNSYLLRLAIISSSVAVASTLFAQTQLPQPEPTFDGKIGLTYKDSTPVKPKLKVPETFGIKDAPNILVVLIDDAGFGQTAPFGGSIPTPTLDRIADNGIRYTRFHTTALCSPTRAALLCGRNHHSVGSGVIGEAGTGFPGYSGIIPASAATFAEVLREYGYGTPGSGRTIMCPIGRRAWWVHSIAGPTGLASITSTASSAATPISSIPRSSRARSESKRRTKTKTVRPTI